MIIIRSPTKNQVKLKDHSISTIIARSAERVCYNGDYQKAVGPVAQLVRARAS